MNRYYSDREKCYKCYRPKSSCMCEYFEHIDTQTKFVLLMHPKEFKKVKNNTGHFTHQILTNSELYVGIDFTKHNRINEIINTHESYILFPSDSALNLSNNYPKLSTKPLAIFLIDSTWSCAKKIFTQSQNLKNLKHMSFETTRVSEYEIKVQPDERYLSTIESALVVLELLNEHDIEKTTQKSFDGFLRPFKKMIEYQKNLIENPLSHAVRFKKRCE